MPRTIRRRAVTFLPIGSACLWILAGACGGDAVTPPLDADTIPVVSVIEMKPVQLYLDSLGLEVPIYARARAEDDRFLYSSVEYPERFSWSSSDPDVVSVDAMGALTSVNWGTATIAATHQGLTSSTRVTVRDAVRLAWSVPIAGDQMSAGVTIGADGTIYAASRTQLYAVSPEGAVRWTMGTPRGMLVTPAIGDDGTLYLGLLSGGALFPPGDHPGLTAVHPDGTIKWERSDLGSISSSPTVASDGTIYAAPTDGPLYAIDPDGETLWTYESTGFFFSSPAVAGDGTIYVGGKDKSLHAINSDGSGRWTLPVGMLIRSSPSIGLDGTIYFSADDERLHAVSPEGTELWSVGIGASPSSSPSIGPDGTIYVGGWGVSAIDPSGSVRWHIETSSGISNSPILGADGTVYVVGVRGSDIYAFDPQGELLWNFETGDLILGSPAIGLDGRILVTSLDGTLYALSENGSTNGGYAGSPWPKEHGKRGNAARAGG